MQPEGGTCVNLCTAMCAVIIIIVCIGCVDMCMGMCVGTRTGMRIDMRIDRHKDTCKDVCEARPYICGQTCARETSQTPWHARGVSVSTYSSDPHPHTCVVLSMFVRIDLHKDVRLLVLRPACRHMEGHVCV